LDSDSLLFKLVVLLEESLDLLQSVLGLLEFVLSDLGCLMTVVDAANVELGVQWNLEH
jgi:hypothetical protein